MVPLSLGILVFTYLWLVLLLGLASAAAGLAASSLTLPLLYLTGYGFLPLQWTPAEGTSLRRSAVLHTGVGTVVFGAATMAVLLASEFLSGGKSGVFLPIGILTVAFAGCVLASLRGGALIRERAPQQVLFLLGVWFGYPGLLFGLALVIGVATGNATYQPPTWAT